MNAADFKRWQDRLIAAKQKWVQLGILGDTNPSIMRMMIEFYRGNLWEHLGNAWAGLSDNDLMTVNKVFPIANSIDGEVAARNPRVEVFPRYEKWVASATPVKHLINYDIVEMNFQRQANRVLRDHFFAPAGFLRHGFTPREEFETSGTERRPRPRRMQLYRPAKPDRPWLRREPIWNTLLDPRARYWHPDEGLEWIAYRDLFHVDDIRDNPNMTTRDGLDKLKGNITPEWQKMDPLHDLNLDDPDREDYIELFTVYEAKERTWFQMTLDGLEKPIRDQDDWPIPWETLPISVLLINEQMDMAPSVPLLAQVAPIQVELNKLRTIMHRLSLNLRRLVGVQKDGLDPSEKTKLFNAELIEYFEMKGMPKDMIQQITIGGFPPEILGYESVLQEDLRELSGQSKMGRAQRINVETAHEVERVQQGQDISTGRIHDGYRQFCNESIRLYMQGRRATMEFTGEEIVRIVGRQDLQGAQLWQSVKPEDLAGEYEFEVEVGSTRPKDQRREVALAAANFQVAASAPDIYNIHFYARKLVEAQGYDPVQALSEQSLVASKVRQLDQIRRSAAPTEENAAEGPAPDANAIAAMMGSNAGQVAQ